jgi:pimeloyl-ACP methyl ester carboxylesterase
VVGHSNGELLALALAGARLAGAVGLVAAAPPPSVAGAPLWLKQLLFSRVFGPHWSTRAVRFYPGWPFANEMPGAAPAATPCPDSGPVMDAALSLIPGGAFDPTPSLP